MLGFLSYNLAKAFVQESIRVIGSTLNQHLILKDNLAIDEVTQEACEHFEQNGIISAATAHACLECTQPYRHSQYENADQMEADYAPVKMVVLDGIVMGPTHCAYDNCTSDLINAREGVFCSFHETQYGVQCHIYDCITSKVNPTEACEQHQTEWKKDVQSHSSENLSGVRQILKRAGDKMPWQPNLQRNAAQPHDQPVESVSQIARKHYFSPNCFYCVGTICAPCGVVIAWTKFDKSESPTQILGFLESVYPGEQSRPDYTVAQKTVQVFACFGKIVLVQNADIIQGFL